MFPRTRFPTLILLVALPLSVAAICHEDETTGTNGITPDVIESFLQQRVDERSDAFFDGLSRLLTAVAGGPADGVTITPNANVINATVDIDLDGDGTRESTVGGGLTFASTEYDLTEGATLSISNIDSPGFSGSLSASATEVGTGTIQVAGGANFPITDGPTVDVPSFGVTVVPFANFVQGFAEVEVGGLSMDVFFEEDGLGGWQMRVVGEDFDFTV